MLETFEYLALLTATFVEAAAIAVIAFGAVQALIGSIAVAVANSSVQDQRRRVYLRFAAWILISLEFALAADIARTMVAPTWDDIGKLAAIAAIRTFLNYFLERDIRELGSEEPAPAAEP